MRAQAGLRLDRNQLGIKASMRLIDRWLSENHDPNMQNISTNGPLFWNERERPLLTWMEVILRDGGIGDFRITDHDTMKLWDWSAPHRWFIKGDQADYDFYSDPSYVYAVLFCHVMVTRRTLAAEARDIVLLGEKATPVFLAGGTIWEAYDLIRRGVEQVTISNYPTPQVDFYRFVCSSLGLDYRITFVNETAVPNSGDILIANEYLEHFQEPITEFERLAVNGPKIVYHRSSFCALAYGHPIPVRIQGVDAYEGKSADGLFDSYLASLAAYSFGLVESKWRSTVRRLIAQI